MRHPPQLSALEACRYPMDSGLDRAYSAKTDSIGARWRTHSLVGAMPISTPHASCHTLLSLFPAALPPAVSPPELLSLQMMWQHHPCLYSTADISLALERQLKSSWDNPAHSQGIITALRSLAFAVVHRDRSPQVQGCLKVSDLPRGSLAPVGSSIGTIGWERGGRSAGCTHACRAASVRSLLKKLAGLCKPSISSSHQPGQHWAGHCGRACRARVIRIFQHSFGHPCLDGVAALPWLVRQWRRKALLGMARMPLQALRQSMPHPAVLWQVARPWVASYGLALSASCLSWRLCAVVTAIQSRHAAGQAASVALDPVSRWPSPTPSTPTTPRRADLKPTVWGDAAGCCDVAGAGVAAWLLARLDLLVASGVAASLLPMAARPGAAAAGEVV